MSHHGGRGYTKTRQIRAERRLRAEEVAAESGYSKLTTQQKLERVRLFTSVPGNGSAAKQLAKLALQLKKEAEPKVEKKSKEVVEVQAVSYPTDANHGYDIERSHNRRGNRK